MASNRPVQLTRDSALVKEFYSAASAVPELERLLGPVMRGEVRSEGVIPRLRKAALSVMENVGRDGVDYPLAARAGAVQILRRVGYGSGQGGRQVDPEGGRKKTTMTVYPSPEQKARFERAAKDDGLSASAWMLLAAEKLAEEAGYPQPEEEEEN